jgi:predicted Zn finger-like uncharacterized protein
MIITCGNCNTSYELDESRVKKTGTQVRCTNCRLVFTAYPADKPGARPETAEDSGPDMLAGLAGVGALAAPGDGDDELDIDMGLDMDLDMDLDSDADADELDLELDLDLGDEDADEDAGADELDLDLDLDLGDEDAGEDELDLDLDLGDEDAGADAGGEDDLGLDLDFGEEEEKVDAGDDLDLSEIEDLVAAQDGAKQGADADIDLVPESDELDISDLEDMLDENLQIEDDDAGDDLDFGLDLGAAAEDEDLDIGEDLDLSDIEGMLEPEDDVAEASDDDIDLGIDLDEDELGLSMEDDMEDSGQTDGMELDFGEDDDGDGSEDDFEMDFAGTIEIPPPISEDFENLEDEIEEKAADKASNKKRAKEEKKRAKKEKKKKVHRGRGMSAPVKMLLVLMLVVIGGIGAVVGLDMADIKVPLLDPVKPFLKNIPYVGDFIKTEPEDLTGNLKMSTHGISSRFIENSKTGRLFVINGKIRSDYEESRQTIRMIGKLYSPGKKLVQTQIVLAGNVLADQDLAGLDMKTIKNRLRNRAKSRINPGQMIPFVVIFNKLPDDLEEFTVEVSGSLPAN